MQQVLSLPIPKPANSSICDPLCHANCSNSLINWNGMGKLQRRFELIVFDWDGTLMDSTRSIVDAIQQASKDVGLPVPTDERARYIIGLGLHDALQHVFPGLLLERYAEVTDRYRHHFLLRDPHLTLFVGVQEMLAELADSQRLLAVATGKSRAGLDRAFSQTGLAPRFDASRCADEGFSKPHPGMLEHIMDRLGVDSERTLMIGDTTHDLQMANNARVASVGVTYGAHTSGELERCAPAAIVDSIAELRAWLQRNI